MRCSLETSKSPRTISLIPPKTARLLRLTERPLTFNQLSKAYWPEDGIAKRVMFSYYDQIAGDMVCYPKDLPMSLHCFSNGIHGQAFYQKDVKDNPMAEFNAIINLITISICICNMFRHQ